MMAKATAVAQVADMYHENKFCLNCGVRLHRGHGYKRSRGYCSQSCYKSKPPKMVHLELLFNKPIREIITEELNRTDNVSLVADLLGIGKVTLYDWLKKLEIERVVEWR